MAGFANIIYSRKETVPSRHERMTTPTYYVDPSKRPP